MNDRPALRRDVIGGITTFVTMAYIVIVNPAIDATFSFMTVDHDGKIRMDPSSPYAMAGLVKLKDRYRVAFGNDVDADRHGWSLRNGPPGIVPPGSEEVTAVIRSLLDDVLDRHPARPTHRTAPQVAAVTGGAGRRALACLSAGSAPARR